MTSIDPDDDQPLDPTPKGKEPEKRLVGKWGNETINLGYVVVPSVILRAQARLHIDAAGLAVLIHLLDHWWQPDSMPWPSKKALAERLGVSEKTIQRAMVRLEREGHIKREERYRSNRGRTSNRYDLSPLVAKLKPIAEEMAKAKAEADKLKHKATRPGPRVRR